MIKLYYAKAYIILLIAKNHAFSVQYSPQVFVLTIYPWYLIDRRRKTADFLQV